ncbi:hypothetical protein V6N12_062671 [Hibiscus sabdariffa]|uniref:Uncharacterized protein n=1 Tax=Hibiscus sabdariffa TaxID=183260 RepID=A0ABR2F9I9_9ROSI
MVRGKKYMEKEIVDNHSELVTGVWCLSVARTLIESTVKIEVEMFANHEQMEALVAEHTMRPSLESKRVTAKINI